MEKIFSGRKALVIGGSGGLGGALALELAQNGASLGITGGSDKKKIENLRKKTVKAGVSFKSFMIDFKSALESAAALDAALKEIRTIFEDVDILVCAFGPFLRKELALTEPSDWHYIVSANLVLPGALISLYLDSMIKKNWGRILLFGGTNTSNIRGFTTTAPYASAKTALSVLAKSVAKNAAHFNVCCNVICPGLTNTEYMDSEAKEYNAANAPGANVLAPADIARFAVDILKNPALNGGTYPIDYGVEVSKV